MSALALLAANLRHFWRGHLGVALGAACTAAVLVGALAVGDSVRHSLRRQAELRIGRVDAVLAVHERFFRADLADRLADELGDVRVAPALHLPGIVRVPGTKARAGIVDVHGVDERFFALGPSGDGPGFTRGAWLNGRLARHLGVSTGDTVLLRIQKPSAMPRDVVLSTVDDISFAIRVEVAGSISDDDFGRYGLQASQVAPFNVFVSLAWLQQEVELAGRANRLLLEGDGPHEELPARAEAALRGTWTLDDTGLEIEELPDGVCELTGRRIFLEDAVAAAAARVDPASLGLLTYFVNDMRLGQRATPYSMVTGVGALGTGGDRPPALARLAELAPPPRGMTLNDWLGRDLEASPGDVISLEYWVMGAELRLRETASDLTVHGVTPLAGAAADRSLMPDFPGLADVENCRDWEPGVPVDHDRIRDRDETYWEEHKGTPKAFVNLADAKALWGNRFGSLTAVRAAATSASAFAERLPRELEPRDVGFFFQDVRAAAFASGTSATDFGGLFLGLSFFLIGAAVLLTTLLFVFGVEQRAREVGAMLAMGFRPRRVLGLHVAEGALIAVLGSSVGGSLGLLYTHGVLWALDSLWRGAVGDTTLVLHVTPTSLTIGSAGAVVVAVAAMVLALRKAFRRPAVELLGTRAGIGVAPSRPGPVNLALIAGGLLGAIALLVLVDDSGKRALVFFGAGALLLIGGLAVMRRVLVGRARGATEGLDSLGGLGVRNIGRRPGRSLATIALLATGAFLVVSVQAHRLEPPGDAADRASGTGGFALFGRSTLPVLRDLATPEGRDAFGLSDDDLAGAAIVPLRVREGDDASCLNLNQPRNPRLVGVDAGALADRDAFTFVSTLSEGGKDVSHPWRLLEADWGDDVVAAIGDQASVQWTIKKSLGETLDYRDEWGRAFRVRIVGTVASSILQGQLVISNARFTERYPSAAGYRMFLIDAPGDRVEPVTARLTRALEDVGLEVVPTGERLAEFNAVQNTYLVIFQVLGGLGLLLGSVGLGVVVLRNSLERRGELAVMSAVGIRSGRLRRMVWTEHGLLLGSGLGVGLAAAFLAVAPGLLAEGAGPSPWPILSLVGLLAVSGALWVGLATAAGTRGSLIDALRDE